jgi:hypothetical protein
MFLPRDDCFFFLPLSLNLKYPYFLNEKENTWRILNSLLMTWFLISYNLTKFFRLMMRNIDDPTVERVRGVKTFLTPESSM